MLLVGVEVVWRVLKRSGAVLAGTKGGGYAHVYEPSARKGSENPNNIMINKLVNNIKI